MKTVWYTRKKSKVDPDPTEPYLIFVCLAKSSAEEMGESIALTVRKAAKLAVYEEIMINVKNHQSPATMRVDVALFNSKRWSSSDFKNRPNFSKMLRYLGITSLPCCINEPMVNHILLRTVKLFSNMSGCWRHGWGLFHSYGVTLQT